MPLSRDGGGNVQYTYIAYSLDDAGRTTNVDNPAPEVDSTLAYDDDGRIASASGPDGSSTWTRDLAGRTTRLVQPGGTLDYAYDAAGRLDTLAQAGRGTFDWDYDAYGRVASLTDPEGKVTGLEYDTAGRPWRRTLGNGLREERSWDARGRLSAFALKTSGGSSLRSESWGYSARSDVLSHTVGSVETLYAYDDEGQLLAEGRPGYATSYTYDGNGNRKTRTVNSVLEEYAYDSGDKLASVVSGGNARTFTYDLAGRMLTDSLGSRSFAWTADSRLASVSSSAGSEGYTYNPFGTRAKVGTRTFLRAGAGVTAGVLVDGNADYTPGISEVRSGTTTYSHSGLKHMAAQSGQSGSVAASREYDAFGGTTGSSGSWQGTFGSGGEFGYEEDASALTYIGERHYDPSTGRFLSRDPVGWGTNWYAYCENDPVAFYDYQGEHPDRITGFTIHGWQSAWSHDGVGVKSEAMVDTIRNGKMRPRPNGTYRFDGPRSVVVLNQDGKVVTTWAKTRDAWRHQVRMYPQEPRVPGKALIPGGGQGSSGGAMGFFSAIVLGLDGFQSGFREVFFYRLRVAAHIRAIDEDKGEADRWEGVEG